LPLRESPASDSSAPPQATLETYLRLYPSEDAIAVAWDQQNLDRIQRVLDARITRNPATTKTETEGFLQTIVDADWDTVERHGGINALMEEIHQAARMKSSSGRETRTDGLPSRGFSLDNADRSKNSRRPPLRQATPACLA